MKKFFGAIFAMSIYASSFGQAGSLDNTLNGNGKLLLPSVNSTFESFAIQVDNKIVMAGNGNNPDIFHVARIHENGNIDSTFGLFGFQTIQITTNGDYPEAIAVQSDGKIIVAGFSSNSTGGAQTLGCVTRLLSDGTLDSSFATDGQRLITFGGSQNTITRIAFQSDGKILLGGSAQASGSTVAAITRLNTNGSTDSSFANSGIFLGSNNGDFKFIIDLKVQVDDKIVCINTSSNSPNVPFSCFRLAANGLVDNSFGNNGTVSVTFGTMNAYARSLDITEDGKILVAGTVAGPGGSGSGLVRLSSNGIIDNSFGANGKVTITGATNYLIPISIKIEPASQKIVMAAQVGVSQVGQDYKTYRLQSNGSIDDEFGTTGYVVADFNAFRDAPTQAFVLQDGRIYIAGISLNTSSGQYYNSFVRYKSCGISITSQPTGITKTEGEHAQFTVSSSSPSATYQWQLANGLSWMNLSNGGQYAGVATPTISISNLTLSNHLEEYRVVCISGLCSDTSAIAILSVDQTNAIEEVSDDRGVKIYPNPFQDKIVLALQHRSSIGKSFNITDAAGKVIISDRINSMNTIIDVSLLNRGMYFLKVDDLRAFKFVK